MRTTALLLLLSCVGISANSTFVTDKAEPSLAGMNPEQLARIPVRMKEFVDAGKTAGIVTLVARHGHVASLEAVGFQDLERKTPMRVDSIFRIMSVTKPVTCAGIMVLVDEGRLSLLDPAERFIPEFKGLKVNPCGTRVGHNCELVEATRPITVLDLMTHTSGLGERGGGRGGAPEPPPSSLAEQIAGAASRATLIFQPGTAWNYTNFGIAVLGRIIEVASGKSYGQFMAERIFRPLGMNDTFYDVPQEKASRLSTVYTFADGHLKPLARPIPAGARIPSPDSGLLSTAADLARFNQMMLNKGVLNGKRVLSPAAVESMTTSYTRNILAGYAPGVGQGYGYEVVREPLGMYRYTSIGSFEKAGVYRTYIWVDPAKDLVGIILMQRNTGGPAADLADEVNIFMAMAAAAVEP
jgi:CubicO group peptidase (beta-lactamase class C family)